MKKNNPAKRGQQDGNQQPLQPEKVGWVRKFCGKGIFREIWKNRYVVLKGDQLYISEKEVKDEKNIQEMFDLSDYEKCEELRKSKSRSKKNHSKFTLAHSRQPGNTAPNLIFLAVSPEEKESWINALNSAITRAKNRILDEVTVEEDSYLAHPTRDRAKIQHSRRPPTRGHLMAVASTSTSDGMLTLDLIQEEEASPEDPSSCEGSFRVDLDKSVGPLTAGRRRSDSENLKPTEKGPQKALPLRKEQMCLHGRNSLPAELFRPPGGSEEGAGGPVCLSRTRAALPDPRIGCTETGKNSGTADGGEGLRGRQKKDQGFHHHQHHHHHHSPFFLVISQVGLGKDPAGIREVAGGGFLYLEPS
ncbi:pleckstrin homology domain-containing family O member 1 isoform X3 [Heliangelus exortis]|uniref:pleckstrin homology domain-containing family O member 1 isoform X3 n=1 Tax=Heliangelus exortis TaxID=472823 RepID=UPI003A90FF27